MAFDIEGAKKAGYTDTEIADYLASQNKFDAPGARKAGYSDAEIIGHLSPQAPEKLGFGDVLGGAIQNAPKDIWGIAKGLFKTAVEPMAETIQPGSTNEGLSDALAGAVSKILPEWGRKTTPEAQASRARMEGAASQFGQGFKESSQLYNIPAMIPAAFTGNLGPQFEKVKKIAMEQPVSSALDILTLAAPFKRGAIGQPAKVGGKTLTADTEEITALAKEKGLPLSASAITPTKTAKAFEWVGESLPTGKGWATLKRQQLQEGLTKMMDETVGGLPANADKFDAGISLGKGLKEAKGNLRAREKAAYGKWEEALGDTPKIMDNTTQLIGEIKDTVSGDTRAWLEAYAKKGTEWTPADIDAFQKQIWSKIGTKGQEGGKLFEALKKDVGPELTPLLEGAKEQGKLLRAFNANDTVRQVLRKYSQDPEQAIRAAFRTGNLDDIKIVKGALDKDTWDIARSRFVENLFDASTEINGVQKTFNPQKFSDIFSKYQRQIQQVMPEKYDDLNKFAKLSKASVADINKINMSQITKNWQTAATGGLGYGTLTGNPAIIVPAGFSFAITKSIMNPKGWLKKWLTEGLELPRLNPRKAATVNALQVGGRQAIGQNEGK